MIRLEYESFEQLLADIGAITMLRPVEKLIEIQEVKKELTPERLYKLYTDLCYPTYKVIYYSGEYPTKILNAGEMYIEDFSTKLVDYDRYEEIAKRYNMSD